MDSKSAIVWKWLIGMLVACNMVLIAIIWTRPPAQMQVGHGGRHNDGMQHGGRRFMDFDKQLNLNKEQQEKFKLLTTDQHHKVDSLKLLARDVRTQFFANVNAPNPDSAKIEQLSTALGNYHKLVELETYTHFRDIRAMLNDEQKNIFDNLIQDVLTHMPEQPHVKGDGLGVPYPREGEGPPREGDRQGPPDDRQGPPGQ